MHPHAARCKISLIVALSCLFQILASSGQDPLPTLATQPLPLPPAQRTVVDAVRAIGGIVRQDESGRVVIVHLQGTKVKDEDLAQLAALPDLQCLYVPRTDISDDGLAHVAKLPKLKRLSLWHTDITDIGLAHLSSAERLQKLDLSHLHITDDGLKHLQKLKSLRFLNLANCPDITDEGLAHLEPLDKLRTLQLDRTSLLTDKGLEQLKSLKGLQTLSVIDTEFTVEGLKDLRKTHPAIRFTPEIATEAEEPALDYFRGLREERPFQRINERMTPRIMHLESSNVTNNQLKRIRELPRIEVLYVDAELITDKALAEIARLPLLRELVFTDAINSFTDDGLKHLIALTNLETLDFGRLPEVTDEGMIHLRKLPKLKSLNISGSKVTSEGVRQLRFCEHLKSITAYETAIDYNAAIEELPGVEITLFD